MLVAEVCVCVCARWEVQCTVGVYPVWASPGQVHPA
jgi:hypothetical protein